MDPSKSTYVVVLSLDMIVLCKFSLGSYVPGSKNIKYELYLDLESGNSLTFERTAGGAILPSVQPVPEQQGARDQDGVAPILSTNLCAGDTLLHQPPTPTAISSPTYLS